MALKRRKKDNYKIINERILEHRAQHAMYMTLFADNIAVNYGNCYDFENYPVTSQAIKKGLDVKITVSALISLEKKGNTSATDILFDRYRNYECGISFNDCLQELRLAILGCEIDSLIEIGYREQYDGESGEYMVILNNDDMIIKAVDDNEQSLVINRLYGAISNYVYKFKQKEVKHISYEIDDNLINIMDRKTLSNYVDTMAIIESDTIRQFKQFIAIESNKTSVNNRQNILDGLLMGLTYREIANKYNIGLSTVGDNIKALKRIYADYFKHYAIQNSCTLKNNDNSIKWLSSDDKKALETTRNRDLLTYINYTIA